MSARLTLPLRARAAVGVALAVLCGVLPAQAHATGPAAPVQAATVAVLSCPSSGSTVPADYLGLSIEWSMVPHWFGRSRESVVAPMVELLKSLQSSPDAAGVLRIGGNSQDGYRWDAGGGETHNEAFAGTINRGMVDALFEVARRSGWKVVLGLNLRVDNPAEAVGLARYAVSQDPTHQLMALELGNEPNAYFGTDLTGYLVRFHAYSQALLADPVTRQTPIAGPDLSNNADLAYVNQIASSYGSGLPFVTWHHYANEPTLTKLLDEAVTTRWTDRVTDVIRAAGPTPARMDEGNSVGRGGLARVSDVMGSSAWLTDTLLSGAQAGLAGYNLHAWDGFYYPQNRRTAFYTPFVIRGGLTYPRPVFYGLALLRDMVGKRFCTTSTAVSPGGAVKSWALIDPVSSRLFVYVVNKDTSAASTPVTITLPGSYAAGGAVSMIADPGGCAGRDTAIDGAELPRTGHFSWSPTAVLPLLSTSTYAVNLGPCQTVLLELPLGQSAPTASLTRDLGVRRAG